MWPLASTGNITVPGVDCTEIIEISGQITICYTKRGKGCTNPAKIVQRLKHPMLESKLVEILGCGLPASTHWAILHFATTFQGSWFFPSYDRDQWQVQYSLVRAIGPRGCCNCWKVRHRFDEYRKQPKRSCYRWGEPHITKPWCRHGQQHEYPPLPLKLNNRLFFQSQNLSNAPRSD